MLKKQVVLIFTLLMLAASFNKAEAQCAMCKRTAETDIESKHKQSAGRSLNNGILYLMSIPYLLGAVGVFAWYKNKKKG